MHPISSQEESWFPVFYRTVRPTLNKHLKRSLPTAIGMWEGPWVFCLKWSGYLDSLTRNKVGFPWSGLNAGSSFIWQDDGMSQCCVEILEETLDPRLIWTGGITSLWHLERHTEFNASKNDEPDSSWKLIGITISLWKLERDAWSATSPPEASVLSSQA